MGGLAVTVLHRSVGRSITAGPMARVVEDLAYMLNAIAGHDPNDPTSSSAPLADYASARCVPT